MVRMKRTWKKSKTAIKPLSSLTETRSLGKCQSLHLQVVPLTSYTSSTSASTGNFKISPLSLTLKKVSFNLAKSLQQVYSFALQVVQSVPLLGRTLCKTSYQSRCTFSTNSSDRKSTRLNSSHIQI